MKNILYMVYSSLSEITDFIKQSNGDHLKICVFFYAYFFNNLILMNTFFYSFYN